MAKIPISIIIAIATLISHIVFEYQGGQLLREKEILLCIIKFHLECSSFVQI